MKLASFSPRLAALVVSFVVLSSCGSDHDDGPRLGTVEQASETPPAKPGFPSDVILPTEAVGYLPGAGSVSATGQAGYQIPLDVPPGRLGIQPQLSLSYGSGGDDGILGVGWGITGLPAIARCKKTHASDGSADGIDWDATDNFCLDGQKLVGGTPDVVDNTLVYRTQHESFTEVRAHLNGGSAASPSKFVARTRDGRVLEFTPIAAQVVTVDPIVPTYVNWTVQKVVWPVAEIRDRSGNSMKFEYEVSAESAAPFSFSYLPKSISYTFSSTAPATPSERQVVFEYEDRLPLDQPFHYSAGLRTVLVKRLAALAMYAPPQPGKAKELAWKYKFSYRLSETTFRSLLSSVKHCDRMDKCKWAKEFSWSHENAGYISDIGFESIPVDSSVQTNIGIGPAWPFQQPPGGISVEDGSEGDIPPGGFTGVLVGDFDNDGRDDALYWDDYKTVEDFSGPLWGNLYVYLKVRISKTGPLSHQYDVGTAKRAVGQPTSGSNSYHFTGLNLGASRAVDIDGDGGHELYLANLPFDSLDLQYAFHKWNGTEFVQTGPWEAKKNVEFTDLDGDGLIDMVETGSNDRWYFRLNTGGAFGAAVDTGVTNNGDNEDNDPYNECYGAPVAGDFDGDGRGDVLVAGPPPCTSQTLISLPDGPPPYNTAKVTTVALPQLSPGAATATKKAHRLADMNGDGLDDIVSSSTIRFNTGQGFLPPIGDELAPFHRITPIDLNGDGRADLITREGDNSYVALSMVGNGADSSFFDAVLEDTGYARVGDFDGDGYPDLLAISDDPNHPTSESDPHKYQRQMFVRKLSLSTDLDLLSEVRDEGASHPRESFTYSRIWNDSPTAQSCTYPQQCLKRGMTVVREHNVSQGERLSPATNRTLYSYDKPRRDVRGRGFLGFGQVTELLDGLFRQRSTTYDNQTCVAAANQEIYPLATLGVVEISPILEQPATVPIGSPPTTAKARVVSYAPAMELAYPTANSYLLRPKSWSSEESEFNVAITSSGVTTTSLVSVNRKRSGTFEYDSWSNPTLVQSATSGGVTSTLRAGYLNNAATWLIGQLDVTYEQVWDANDAVPTAREVDRDYDAAGRLWRITREPSATDSLWQQLELVYDPLGLVTSTTQRVKTGESNRVESYYYDVEKTFVEQTQNAAGHWQTQVFHPAFGVSAVAMDPNGVTTSFSYDGFGRPRGVKPAGGMKVDRSYKAYQAVAGINAGLEIADTGGDGSQASSRVDELERTFESRHRGFNGTWVVEDVAYNVFGVQTSVSRPGAGTASPNRTQVVVDSLGRLVRTVEPNGATTTVLHSVSPTGSASTTTNPDGHQRTVRMDQDDRVVWKEDRLDASTLLSTQYTWQPFNLPEFIFDPLQNKTAASYDRIGRRTSLVDPDLGTTAYGYTGFDDPKTETTALGTRTYYFDQLGRVTTITDSDGGRFFAWDTAPNGIGKLARTESPDQIVVNHYYDSFSRPDSQVVSIGFGASQEQFKIGVTYDALHGRPETLTYPAAPGRAAFVVKNIYNGYGYLESRRDGANLNNIYWSVTSRELDGSLKSYSQEKLVQNIGHDAYTGDVNAIQALRTDTNAELLSLGYKYTPGGNIETRSEGVSGRVETFVYDGLDRLERWTLSSTVNSFVTRQTVYAYDKIGNLTDITVNGTLVDKAVFNGPKPHAMTSLNGQSFAYDARGRQYDGPKRGITFNAFDLPKKITNKATAKDTTYKYDADENRVRKIDPSGAITTYIGGIYERRQDATGTQHVFLVPGEDGPALQMVFKQGVGDTRYYLCGDLHGSVNLVVDGNLNVLERRYSEPFGGRVEKDGKPIATPTSVITAGFTGHEDEGGLGLINMRGRMYDPAQRRFLTPDPLITDPLFSQSYNRYSYVLNNPLRYTDPSGFQQLITATPQPPAPPDGAGPGHYELTITPHGTGYLYTWRWRSDPPPPPPPPVSDGEAERNVARGNEVSKQQIDWAAHERRGGGAYAVPRGGDKWHPYSNEGKAHGALFGGEKPIVANTQEVDKALIKVGSFAPGGSLLTLLDPDATPEDKAIAVALDVASLVGVGMVAKLAKGAAKGVTIATRVAAKIPAGLKKYGMCVEFAGRLQQSLQRKGISGTLLRIEVRKYGRLVSDSVGPLAATGGEHFAVRVGDTVFDNLRPGGISYQQFMDDIGLPDAIRAGAARLTESSF